MKPFLFFFTIFSLLCYASSGQGNSGKPRITGQRSLTVNEDEKITILMTYLDVQDADDWFYPWGFTMHLYPGEHYSLQGHVVSPAKDFHGKIAVNVTVHDGEQESNIFKLEITVVPVNDRPRITGHQALTINQDQPLTILPEHLQVTDPDNTYPKDFTLRVHNGNNYTLNGNQITPAGGFTGTLSVNVSVFDGTIESDMYALPVTVRTVDRVPRITGQVSLQVNEDNPITLALSQLTVVDDDSNYPNGFSLLIAAGKDYTFAGTTVTPQKDFHGPLSVVVTVSDGQNTSKPFSLSINVTPVDDAPVLSDLEGDAIHYSATSEPVLVTESLIVREVDGDSIMFAEVRIRAETYQRSIDKLTYTAPPGVNIKGVFDPNTGILTLMGQASPQAYTAALRSVKYECQMPSRDLTKVVSFSANDGKTDSEEVTRLIAFGKVPVALDIPGGFTPNGDKANDTWRIIPLKEEEAYAQARVRIYNKEGILLYEAVGFDNEWDGRYNGQLLPADVYFYTIDLNLNAPEGYLKGMVALLR